MTSVYTVKMNEKVNNLRHLCFDYIKTNITYQKIII